MIPPHSPAGLRETRGDLQCVAEGVQPPEPAELATSDAGEVGGWRLPTRALRLIGRHEALEHALRQRGIDLIGIDSALRTGELGLMPITASTPLPDLERWLGPGAQALPVLIHADSIALAPPVSRCGSDLALLFAHNSGCAGAPHDDLLAAAAERIEASLCSGAPWPRVQLRRQGTRVLAPDWPTPPMDVLLECSPDPSPAQVAGTPLRLAPLASAASALGGQRLESQLQRHGFEHGQALARALLALLEAVLLDRDERGFSLRPTLSIHGEAGSTLFELQLREGILIASETWAHGLDAGAGVQLSCRIEHAVRSQRFGLLGRSLAWLEAGEALGRLRDAAAALGFNLRDSAPARAIDSPRGGPARAPSNEGLDLAWSCALRHDGGSLGTERATLPHGGHPSAHHFLRQGPEPAGLVPLLESLRPPTLEPGLSLLLVHRTRGDRLSRRVYRSRTRRWESLETLDACQSGSEETLGYAQDPGNRIYLLSPLPGEQPGESVDGYLRRARDAGEWSQRLRQHLPTHGLAGYRLGRFDSEELVGALPALRTSREHVLNVLAVGIEAPEELFAGY